MPRLPVVSGRQAVVAFQRAGFEVKRQQGSHIIMSKPGSASTLSVPDHRELKPGTLRVLVRKAGLAKEQFDRVAPAAMTLDPLSPASTAPDPAILAEVVRRIVEVAHPDRIVLFGSAARGQMGPDSDLDLLVVKSGVSHRRRLAQQIYRRLLGLTIPVDAIVVTPEDVERYRDKVGPIIGSALAEGQVVYGD